MEIVHLKKRSELIMTKYTITIDVESNFTIDQLSKKIDKLQRMNTFMIKYRKIERVEKFDSSPYYDIVSQHVNSTPESQKDEVELPELTFDIELINDLLTITPSRSFTPEELIKEFFGDALFWKDMYFYESHIDGWSYIHDSHNDYVYPMNDYGYNLISDLMKGKQIKVMNKPNDEDYKDYEWNFCKCPQCNTKK